MGSFSEHIQQSKNNLDFLAKVNAQINDRWDWQVTTCFYVGVHLINAHIVSNTSKNYLSHHQVSEVINPYNQLSPGKLSEDIYASYVKLQLLSRRSRYLLNENFKKKEMTDIQPACITHDKHFRKAVYHLDKIMDYIKTGNNVQFQKHPLKCIELRGGNFSNFSVS